MKFVKRPGRLGDRFLRRGASATVLALAVLVSAGVASAGIVTPHRIDETFTGASIDYTHTWWFWNTNQPDSVTFDQANGVMNINIAAIAQNGFFGGGATLCRARGDFDATVDFNLPTWPTSDGIWVTLQMTGTPFNVYRVTWQYQPNEAYGAYFPPGGSSLPATGTSGTLRLSRRGDIFTGYYRNGPSWVPIASGVGPTDDASVSLGVSNNPGVSPFLGLPATITFDNLHVFADKFVCP
jgi:hypothetical protein